LATVRKATSKVDGKIYCVKEVTTSALKTSQIKQLKSEGELLKSLNHPNIIKAYDTFQTKDHIYIILELCTGGSIQHDVDSNGTYTEQRAIPIVRQILSALNHMHKKFVSHRDLKPENILYSNESKTQIKIIDFGFGKEYGGEQNLLFTHLGTWNYMAPEMRESDEQYDYEKIDIWAAGCVMYFLLYGHPPFHKSLKALDDYVENGKFPFENTTVQVSEEAKSLFVKLLAPEASARPSASVALTHPWLNDK